MASTYSNLKFELIATGEQSGAWGATTNTNIGTAIEQAIVGMATLDTRRLYLQRCNAFVVQHQRTSGCSGPVLKYHSHFERRRYSQRPSHREAIHHYQQLVWRVCGNCQGVWSNRCFCAKRQAHSGVQQWYGRRQSD